MERIIHFISGLPRSGSTILCNLLAQNPRFHTTATSGIVHMIVAVRNQWDNCEEFKAFPDDEAKLRVMQGMLNAYTSNTDRPVFFDKGRMWLKHVPLADALLNRKAKFIVTVRDMRDILASMEKLWRKNSSSRLISQEAAFPLEFQTLAGRCKVWSDATQLIGGGWNVMKNAADCGYHFDKERIYTVKFEELTTNPNEILKGIYEFLGEELFKHNPDKIEQYAFEDDRAYNIIGLHDIRSKIQPVKSDWEEILGEELGKVYSGYNIWW